MRRPTPRSGLPDPHITEEYGVRTLHLGSQAIQSAQRLNDPDNLAVAYTRAMLAALP